MKICELTIDLFCKWLWFDTGVSRNRTSRKG